MKNEKHFGLRIEEEMLQKFRYVCEYKGRSANKQIIQMIKHLIDEYENEHGEIQKNSDDK